MRPATPFVPPPSLAELLAAGPVALFLDFDGTLVGIAARPDAIEVPEGLSARLERLADRLSGRVALVSGRALEDLHLHLGPIEIARAGSHGADLRHADGAALGGSPRSLDARIAGLVEAFASDRGLLFETKAHGCALHYRSRPEAGESAEAFMRAIAASESLATKDGKCVVELVHEGADKGGAVRAFMAQAPFVGARPVFLGDDITDEDGFAACAELGGMGILVGDHRDSAAQFRLPDIDAVHNWLEL